MSTRSIVAIAEGDGWRGQYHHSDGYPSGMGACLYHGLKGKTEEELIQWGELLNAHKSGWSNFQVWGDNGPSGVDLEGGRCYCHWEGREEDNDNTRKAEQSGGFREEYLYVIAPKTQKIYVYDTHDNRWDAPEDKPASDILIGVIYLDHETAPDFDLMEQSSRDIMDVVYASEVRIA